MQERKLAIMITVFTAIIAGCSIADDLATMKYHREVMRQNQTEQKTAK